MSGFRNGAWNAWNRFKFRSYQPVVVTPPVDGPAIGLVPLHDRYDEVGVTRLLVPESIPADEAEKPRSILYRVQARLLRWFSPNAGPHQPIDADPQRALETAYPDTFRAKFRAPVLPEPYRDGIDLGAVAYEGPYTGLLAAGDDGGLHWDLRHLDDYEHHAGLRTLGATVDFVVDGDGLRATRIDCDLGVVGPGDADWQEAGRLALCAASTAISMEQHFTWLHYVAGLHVAAATRTALPAAHPLCRLLWPHIFRTHFTTDIITEGQLVRGADLECMYSFTSEGVWKLFDHAAERFDLAWIDPQRSAEARGLTTIGVDLPPLANRLAHLDVMHAHARRYLDLYYPSDAALADDTAVVAFVDQLQRLVPNGLGGLLGTPPTVEELARFVGSFIHLATVEHEMVGAGAWDYQLWPHAQPCRVAADGSREPVDVYQRLVNFNFLLNVPRTPLLQDFSGLAIDEPGRDEFRRFLRELEDLDVAMQAERGGPWRFTPAQLQANINV